MYEYAKLLIVYDIPNDNRDKFDNKIKELSLKFVHLQKSVWIITKDYSVYETLSIVDYIYNELKDVVNNKKINVFDITKQEVQQKTIISVDANDKYKYKEDEALLSMDV